MEVVLPFCKGWPAHISIKNDAVTSYLETTQCCVSWFIKSESGYGSGSGSGSIDDQKLGKNTAVKTLAFKKNCNLFIPRPSAVKRENPALQKMKFINVFSYFVGNFCPPESGSRDPLNPDPTGSGSGSTILERTTEQIRVFTFWWAPSVLAVFTCHYLHQTRNKWLLAFCSFVDRWYCSVLDSILCPFSRGFIMLFMNATLITTPLSVTEFFWEKNHKNCFLVYAAAERKKKKELSLIIFTSIPIYANSYIQYKYMIYDEETRK